MQHKTKISLYLIPITLCLLSDACKKDLTPIDNTPPEIKLTVEDIGVMEVWLRLNVQDKSFRSQITISRDDSTIQQFNNLTTDTLIYDSGLLPNREYNYEAVFSSGLQPRYYDDGHHQPMTLPGRAGLLAPKAAVFYMMWRL